MTRKTLIQILILILMSSALYSQDLKGQWKGTLNVQNNRYRLIFHVTKNDTLYKATLDSPDQIVNDIVVTTTNFNYPALRFDISIIGAVYEGTMSDNRITGIWMQSGQTFPLILLKPNSGPNLK
jgi:hypothetical protein